MNKFEKMEELKTAMLRKTFYRDGIPEEIINIVREAFEGLLNRYDNLACNNLNIQQYMEGNIQAVKSYINENLGERRKEYQLEQVQGIVRKLERDLEQSEEELNKEKEEQNKEQINEIDSKNQEMTDKIMQSLEESLRDVQLSQNRILDSNGFSMDRIDQINQNAQGFIRDFIKRNEEKVYGILEKDSTALKNDLLNEYEQYTLQNGFDYRTDEKQKEQNEKSKRQEFLEGLDSGISLEEQRDFSIKQSIEAEKKREEKTKEHEEDIDRLDENVII